MDRGSVGGGRPGGRTHASAAPFNQDCRRAGGPTSVAVVTSECDVVGSALASGSTVYRGDERGMHFRKKADDRTLMKILRTSQSPRQSPNAERNLGHQVKKRRETVGESSCRPRSAGRETGARSIG